MKSISVLLCFLFIYFINTALFAQVPDWQWAVQASESEYSGNEGYSITLDETGNSYVTGHFSGTSTFGAISLTSNGMYDVFVAKVDDEGNWIWAIQAGGNRFDCGNSIIIDEAGNSYITGHFENTVSFGSTSLTSSGSYDIFIAKVDDEGNWVWATQAGGNDYDSGYTITLDEAGNSYIIGLFEDTASFGSTSLTSSGSSDIFIAKLDINGNWQWAVQAGGIGYDYGNSIISDEDGNSYITGMFSDTATFGSTSLTSGGHFDAFVAKLNTEGNWQWVTQASGIYTDRGESIILDEAGNSYVTGSFQDIFTLGTISLISSGSSDIFVAKLDTNGNWQWANQAGGLYYDKGNSITLDEAGNSYITGFFHYYSAVFGSTSLISNGDEDIFVAKLGPDGNWQWAIQAGGSDYDEGCSITLDATGNSYITGVFRSTAIFGSITLDDDNFLNLFVAKLGNVIADFSVDQTSIPLGDEIQFTDLSTNNPISWEWDFENDGVIDSYEQNPNTSYLEVGNYTVSLRVFNENSTDAEIKIDYINVTSTSTNFETISSGTKLYDNYPNPFNPSTTIEFSLQNHAEIEVTIFNTKGQKIKTLINNNLEKGNHSINWNGNDESGKSVSSGIYYYQLIVNGKTEAVEKCLLLK